MRPAGTPNPMSDAYLAARYRAGIMTAQEELRAAYYHARRSRILAREHYDAAVYEEQRLAQKLWQALNPEEDDGA